MPYLSIIQIDSCSIRSDKIDSGSGSRTLRKKLLISLMFFATDMKSELLLLSLLCLILAFSNSIIQLWQFVFGNFLTALLA